MANALFGLSFLTASLTVPKLPLPISLSKT